MHAYDSLSRSVFLPLFTRPRYPESQLRPSWLKRHPELRLLFSLAALCVSFALQANNLEPSGQQTSSSQTTNQPADNPLYAMQNLQQRWAEIKYRLPQKQQQAALEQLSNLASKYLNEYPQTPELLIWRGVILSTYAGIKGGLSALSLVNQAKESFEQALEINPDTLSGSAYTSLGALYYQAPGWPISFGNDKKARELLEKALKIDPYGIDSNYFYADFLVSQNDFMLAHRALDKALLAPDRPNRTLADEGRRQEIVNLLSKIGDKHS